MTTCDRCLGGAHSLCARRQCACSCQRGAVDRSNGRQVLVDPQPHRAANTPRTPRWTDPEARLAHATARGQRTTTVNGKRVRVTRPDGTPVRRAAKPYRPWTRAEIERAKELLAEGKTYRAVALLLERDHSALRRKVVGL